MGAGLIPQAFIDELLSKIDIVHLIDSYIPLKKHGTSHTACCPFHDEKTPSFHVVPKKQFYHCFGCGASGNAISFVMSYLNQSFPQAIETLATQVGLEVPKQQQNPLQVVKNTSLYALLDQIAAFYEQQLKTSGHEAVQYLNHRCVGEPIRARYQIGYAPKGWHTLSRFFRANEEALISAGMLVQKDNKSSYDRFRHRIMFPIHDTHGRLIGFGGRTLDDTEKPKYLNSPETVIFQKSRELYGLYQVLAAYPKEPPPEILIVEGYMDVIALAEHGVCNAVATLGTTTSIYHIQRLSKHTHHLVYCFDGDEAGLKAALRALESTLPALDGKLNARFVFLPKGEDPDSLIRQEGRDVFMTRIKNAIPLHEYLLTILTKSLDITNLAGKSQLLDAISPYWHKIPDGPYKQLLLNELARITHLELDRIEKALNPNQSHVPLSFSPKPIKRTPLRLAIALLLQHPHLYTLTQTHLPPLSSLNEPNQILLKQLLEYLSHHPTANTATLIERFRDSKYFEIVNQLAAWNTQVPTDSVDVELIETCRFLTRKRQAQEIERLIEKARHQGLTKDEQYQLQTMLQKRHQQT